MDMLSLIVILSAIMWYLIDRAKKNWEGKSWGKYVTIGCSAIAAFAISFGYKLDLVYALGVVDSISLLGTILTAFALMGGSSCIAEIIGAASKKSN